MSDTNRVKIRYARESSWGETPSGPAMTVMRVTSENLQHQKNTVTSNEIRSDRQRSDVLEVGQAAQGPVNFELIYGEFEQFFETALRGSIASTKVANTSTVFAASTITGSTGANFTGLEAGQWIRIYSPSVNDGAVAKVASVASTVVTITGTTLTASTVSANVIGRTLKNGTTETSFLVEADFEDINGVKYFNGLRPNQVSLDVQSQQIVTGVFEFMGKRGFTASTSVASATTSAGANTPMTAAVDVGDVRENDVVLTDALQAITMQLNNNMRAKPQIGSKTSAEHGDGGVDVTGTVTFYFENIAQYEKFIDHTATSLSFQFSDADGNDIIVTLPQVHYTAGNPAAGGQDQDVFLPVDYTAYRDATTGETVRMDFLPAT